MRQIMRLRGFSLMNNILSDYAKDIEISIAVRQNHTWTIRNFTYVSRRSKL